MAYKCSKCNIEKDKSAFHKDRRSLNGLRSRCKQCGKMFASEPVNKEEHKLKKREYDLKKDFGISLNEYNDIYMLQNGQCGICGIHQKDLKISLSVDHDHLTGKIRGLLCTKCNTALGLYNDNEETLLKAILWLRK